MPRPDASDKLAAATPKQGPSKVLIAAVIALVIVIVGGVAWLRTDPFGGLEAKGPKGSVAEGNGVVAYPDVTPKKGAPVVDVYEDYQCPHCAALEKANGKSMAKMAADGDIKLVIHTMSFMDDNLGNDSSTRAANASFCAADAGALPQFSSALFARQSPNGQGYSAEVLSQAANAAGISGAKRTAFDSCVSKGNYNDYVEDSQERANDDGINGTPKVLIDGNEIDEKTMTRLTEEPGSFPRVLADAK